MAKKSILTLGGLPGSGKSTVRKILADSLGYDTFSTGDFMRSLAAERGTTLEALNSESARDNATDLIIDGKVTDLVASQEALIIDSILAYHFAPDAFHVFLDVPIDESARRIFGDKDAQTRVQSGDSYTSVEEAKAHVEMRIRNHQERYKAHYGLDPYAKDQYDLVIDTSTHTPKEVADIILTAYQEWQNETQ